MASRRRSRSSELITANWRICSRCVPERSVAAWRAGRQGDGDAHRADGDVVLLGRAGDAGEAEADVGAEQPLRALGHLDRRRLVDDRTGRHLEQVELDLAGVGHDAAAEHVAGAGDGRQPGGDEPAGERLGEPERQPCGAQQVEHDRLHRLAVDAEHERPEHAAQRRPPTRRARPPPPRRSGRRVVRRTSRPFQPRARKAIVGSPASSRRAMMPSRRSLSPLSLSPHVCRTRLAMTDDSPAAGPQVGQHGPLEHVLHLVGHTGHGVDDLVADRADQPGRRAAGLRDHRRPDRHERLAQVVLRHRAGRGREQLADHLGDRRVRDELDAHHRGDGVAGDVVVRRTEAAARRSRRRRSSSSGAARPRCARRCRRP